MSKLYRVFTHTSGDESITERLVSADSVDEAEAKAIGNVKAQNLGKGDTAQATSQANTTILSVKECGKQGVLAINRLPLTSISAIAGALQVPVTPPAAPSIPQEWQDFKNDILNLADLGDNGTFEEAIVILTAKLSAEA